MWWLRSSFFWLSGRYTFMLRFLPLILLEQHLSDSQIGIVISTASLTVCVLVPIITGIADFQSNRFSMFIIVCVASALISLLFLLPYYWFNITNNNSLIFYWSMVIMILYSIPDGNVYPCLNALCLMVISENKEKYGPLRSFGSLAWGLFHIIIGVLLEFNIIQLHYCVYLYAVSTLPIIVSAYFAFHKINHKERKTSVASVDSISSERHINLIEIGTKDEDYGSTNEPKTFSSSPNADHNDNSGSESEVSTSSKLSMYFITLKYIFSKSYTIGIFMVAAIFGGGWTVVQSLLFVYIVELNDNDNDDAYLLMGLSVGAATVIEVPLMYCTEWFVNHLGYRNMIFIGMGFYIIRLIGYTLLTSDNLWLLLIIEMIQGFTYALIHVSVVTLISIIFPDHLCVTAQGLLTSIKNGIAPFVFVLTGGYIMEYIGGIWLYRILAGLVFLTTICFYFLSRNLNKLVNEKQNITVKL